MIYQKIERRVVNKSIHQLFCASDKKKIIVPKKRRPKPVAYLVRGEGMIPRPQASPLDEFFTITAER